MSARSGIAKALAAGLAKNINGTGFYVNNLYENVSNKVIHFDDIMDFPFISITPGPESRDDMPSNFTWADLTVYIRIYVKNTEDAQGELESLITDVETFVDTHLKLEYNVSTFQGSQIRTTVTNNIVSITTDEGILDPNALGEVALNVRYEKIRQF